VRFLRCYGYFGIEAFRGGSMGGFHFSEALCSSLPYKRLIASRNDSAATARQKYFEKRRIMGANRSSSILRSPYAPC
jgi:hypothetical protein